MKPKVGQKWQKEGEDQNAWKIGGLYMGIQRTDIGEVKAPSPSTP